MYYDIVPTSSLVSLKLQMHQEKMLADFQIASTNFIVKKNLVLMMLCPLILELLQLLYKSKKKKYCYTKIVLATYMEGVVLYYDIVPTSSLVSLKLQMHQEKRLADFQIASAYFIVNKKLPATLIISK